MLNQHSQRKNEHVSLAEFYNRQNHRDEFDQLRFISKSFPEMNYDEANPETQIGPLTLKWPFYIEAMTGGSTETGKINQRLAKIAQATNIAMATGSESVALHDEKLIPTFSVVRRDNPRGLVFANLGVDCSVIAAKKAISWLQADAIELHVNPMQEMIMPEGSRNFKWLTNLKHLVSALSIPVIVKEVGFGMSKETLQQLKKMGVKYVNVSGRGGTNFAKIENARRNRVKHQNFPELDQWGETTPESLLESREYQKDLIIIAAGGIKSPLDVAKALALGAKAVGVAGIILHSLLRHGDQATINLIKRWQMSLKIIMTALGCHNLVELRQQKLILSPGLINYLKQRHLKY